MPLPTTADIARGTRAQQVQQIEFPAVRVRYPNSAGDDLTDVPGGYFDLTVDADAVLAARGSLQSADRKRFAVEVDGLIWFDEQIYYGVRLIDAAISIDLVCMVARYAVDCDNERTRFELLG